MQALPSSLKEMKNSLILLTFSSFFFVTHGQESNERTFTENSKLTTLEGTTESWQHEELTTQRLNGATEEFNDAMTEDVTQQRAELTSEQVPTTRDQLPTLSTESPTDSVTEEIMRSTTIVHHVATPTPKLMMPTTSKSDDRETKSEESFESTPETPARQQRPFTSIRFREASTVEPEWANEGNEVTTTPFYEDDEEDVTNEIVDQEIAKTIRRTKLDPRRIPDKTLSGSFGPFNFEAGLNKLKMYNISSFVRNGPVKLKRTSLERNVELELDLKSHSLILNGSAVLYLMGIGPRFDFEGSIDSVQLRVLFSYHRPKNAKDGSVRVKEYELMNKKITPSLKITRPRSLTKFISNIFFSRIVPYLGGILLPTIETVGREIVHELVHDHGFVNSIMKKYHESNYVIDESGEVID